jgi:cell shape-determining protein MreC
MVLENVGLNIYTYNPAAITASFHTYKIPEFINVTSEGIARIVVFYADSNKLFTDNNEAVWNRLFNFGYSIYTENKEIVINTMHDLYKACCNKKVWSKITDAMPYRLNKDVKLTDIIDVSGFESYQNNNLTVTIYDNKFGILITKDTKCLKTYYEDMFRGKDVTQKDLTEGIVNVPKTADGYYVIPFRH